MNKENCALKLVDEIILYYDARSKKHQIGRHLEIFRHCQRVISGFRREVDENCAVLGYCTTSSGNPLPTFRDKLLVPKLRDR